MTTLTREQIPGAQLLIARSALGLELLGLKHSRGSVYAFVKREFGFKGSKVKVWLQLDEYIHQHVLPRDAAGEAKRKQVAAGLITKIT